MQDQPPAPTHVAAPIAAAAQTRLVTTAVRSAATTPTVQPITIDDAYLRPFLNADPTQRFPYTRYIVGMKGTLDYQPLGDAQYQQLLADAGQSAGYANFARTAQGALTYKNTGVEDVLVVYGRRADAPAQGALVVHPGQSVTLPAPSLGNSAGAQLTSTTIGFIAVAYPGAPIPQAASHPPPTPPKAVPPKAAPPKAAPKPAPPKAVPPAKPAPVSGPSLTAGAKTSTNPAQRTGYTGQCTDGAYRKWYEAPGGSYYPALTGNAKDWPASARALGYTVTTTPRANAMVIFQPNVYYADPLHGHVGWVDSVSADGKTITVTEMNYGLHGEGFNKFSTHTYKNIPGMSYILKP